MESRLGDARGPIPQPGFHIPGSRPPQKSGRSSQSLLTLIRSRQSSTYLYRSHSEFQNCDFYHLPFCFSLDCPYHILRAPGYPLRGQMDSKKKKAVVDVPFDPAPALRVSHAKRNDLLI